MEHLPKKIHQNGISYTDVYKRQAMYQAQREMENYERRKVYHRAYYSLDAYSWLENYALEHSRSCLLYTSRCV